MMKPHACDAGCFRAELVQSVDIDEEPGHMDRAHGYRRWRWELSVMISTSNDRVGAERCGHGASLVRMTLVVRRGEV